MTKAESEAAAILGRKGGQSKSPKKQAASRENGKKGGRPRKEKRRKKNGRTDKKISGNGIFS